MAIVVVEPGDEGSSTVGGSSIGTVIGPALLESADEALGFAIGTGRVGASVEMSDAALSAGTVEAFGDVAAAVVGHDTLDGYAACVEEGHSTLEELGAGVLVLFGHHLDVGDPTVVIHSDMCELPPCSTALAGQVTMDTVSRTNDTGEFLGIQVQDLTRTGPFVPLYWWFGLQIPESSHALPTQAL